MIKVIFNKLLRYLFDFSGPIIGPKLIEEINTIEVCLAKDFNIKIYKPFCDNKTQELPILIYYHGGGWTIGSLKAYDNILRYICSCTKHIVVGVEYRKAPEYKFPIAAEDAIKAYDWVIDNIDAIKGDMNSIAIGGDSAGGNLTCVVLNDILNNNKIVPKKLVLIYPVLDVSEVGIKDAKKRVKSWIGKFACCILNYQLNQYINNTSKDVKSALMCPDINKLNLNNISSLLITAEHDPLLVAAEDMVRSFKENNMQLKHLHYPGTLHGFVNFVRFSHKAKQAIAEIIKFLTC